MSIRVLRSIFIFVRLHSLRLIVNGVSEVEQWTGEVLGFLSAMSAI